jgi:hypothetical protein
MFMKSQKDTKLNCFKISYQKKNTKFKTFNLHQKLILKIPSFSQKPKSTWTVQKHMRALKTMTPAWPQIWRNNLCSPLQTKWAQINNLLIYPQIRSPGLSIMTWIPQGLNPLLLINDWLCLSRWKGKIRKWWRRNTWDNWFQSWKSLILSYCNKLNANNWRLFK